MKKLSFILMILFITGSGFTSIEKRMISGKVTDAETGSTIAGVNVVIKGTTQGAITDTNGEYEIKVAYGDILVFSFIGYLSEEIKIENQKRVDLAMRPDLASLEEVVVIGYGTQKSRSSKRERQMGRPVSTSEMAAPVIRGNYTSAVMSVQDQVYLPHNTEGYTAIHENEFIKPTDQPLSTFSIDVDAASYSNVRRFINNGSRPPIDAVRIEEMINYFDYEYPQPQGEDPIKLVTEISECPWNTKNRLVHVGMQGRRINTDDLPPSNLVFLIDVSGSMSSYNKLPLLQSSLKMLTKELRPEDRVAIVVYAGAAGMVLPSTSGKDKDKIIEALDQLQAGGSTAGGAGIKLAYKIAEEHFVDGGNNRVILATDGDFNVGASSNAEMERLIEEKRESGVFLTVLGYGMGNYKDDKMEILADKGNGNYAYIDNIQEAKKVLVNEFGGTLFTIAKDVKLQIEFNPDKVQGYRLIGYENRLLADEDFNDDTKDAGELGAGHTVTALYEIIPVGVESEFLRNVDPLKYQKKDDKGPVKYSDELMTIKFRYKDPEGSVSKKIEQAVIDNDIAFERTSDNFRFSAAVAIYGMILRESKFLQNGNLETVIELAEKAKGKDKDGYRSEFIRLVKTSEFLALK